jgi:hypothetical protein
VLELGLPNKLIATKLSLSENTVEAYIYDSHGRMENPGFLDYRIPVASDLPMIEPVMVEVANPNHPYGAKGVAEVNICPPMAAIANAIDRAVGVLPRLTTSYCKNASDPRKIEAAYCSPRGDAHIRPNATIAIPQCRADKRTNIQVGMTSMAPSRKLCHPQCSVVDRRLAARCMTRCRLPTKCNGSIPIAVKASPTSRESASSFATATNGLSPKIRVSMIFPFFSPANQSRSGLRGRVEGCWL